ncbi:XF1762 family protein [uncultured Muribaculum sp.]|uniref:XF1762 family protein n=1 Tax=Bacteria TaxID=2 RepID=UPI00266B69A7|nr:XF1762 family protein [uncultured Muribaculum sp.]
MEVRQTTLKEANAYVERYHRHHDRVVGHKWSLAAYKDGRLCGVAIVGRPTGRRLDDGETLEVTRLCTDGTRNACSCLYAAAARKAKREGYSKIITFILQSEPGTSLRAAGWTMEAAKAGKPEWNAQRYADRPVQLSLFSKKQPPAEYKQRWAKQLHAKEEDGHV